MTFFSYYDIFDVGCDTMKKGKKVFNFMEVTIVAIVSSLVMCLLGGVIVYRRLGGIDFSLLGKDGDLKSFISAYNNLVDNYYDEVEKKELIDGAIEGMYASTGDPYTMYLDKNNAESLDESLNGHYDGVGIVMSKNDNNEQVLTQVVIDSPAEKAGLLPGDILKQIDGEDLTGKSGDYISEKILELQSFKITVDRMGQLIEANLSVEKLYKPVVESRIIEENGKKIGYIKLSVFNDTSDLQISSHLSRLESVGIDSLILDLRSNTGGYLQMAENIAEMFLENGKIIYSLDGKTEHEIIVDSTNEKRRYPIVVLINERSASASEILAGALKYSYGATIVGKKSYGKGKVQKVSELTDGTSLKYTSAKWLMPNGECLDGTGLKPDIEIEYEEADPTYKDTQIMGAVKNLVER